MWAGPRGQSLACVLGSGTGLASRGLLLQAGKQASSWQWHGTFVFLTLCCRTPPRNRTRACRRRWNGSDAGQLAVSETGEELARPKNRQQAVCRVQVGRQARHQQPRFTYSRRQALVVVTVCMAALAQPGDQPSDIA